MPWYLNVSAAVTTMLPALCPTQAANLALLVAAILAQRTLCLIDLARAYPTPSAVATGDRSPSVSDDVATVYATT